MESGPGLRSRLGEVWRSGCWGKLLLGAVSYVGCLLGCVAISAVAAALIDFDAVLIRMIDEILRTLESGELEGQYPALREAVVVQLEALYEDGMFAGAAVLHAEHRVLAAGGAPTQPPIFLAS